MSHECEGCDECRRKDAEKYLRSEVERQAVDMACIKSANATLRSEVERLKAELAEEHRAGAMVEQENVTLRAQLAACREALEKVLKQTEDWNEAVVKIIGRTWGEGASFTPLTDVDALRRNYAKDVDSWKRFLHWLGL